MGGILYAVSAASGTGKTSLVKALRQQVSYLTVSVSHTTRQPRPGEEDGLHYHFVDVATFKKMIARKDFIEFAQVFDNFYGTSKAEVQQQLQQNQNVLLEIDWQGALQVKHLFPQAVLIFILPPSKLALRERLSNRGQDSQEVIEKRLAGSVVEMQQFSKFDYIIINDDFEDALSDLCGVVRSEQLKTSVQSQRQAQLIQSLLA